MYPKANSNLNWTDTFYVMQKWTKDYWATLKQIKINVLDCSVDLSQPGSSHQV